MSTDLQGGDEMAGSGVQLEVAAALAGVQVELRNLNNGVRDLSGELRGMDGRMRVLEGDVAIIKARPEPRLDSQVLERIVTVETRASYTRELVDAINSRRMSPKEAIATAGVVIAMFVGGITLITWLDANVLNAIPPH